MPTNSRQTSSSHLIRSCTHQIFSLVVLVILANATHCWAQDSPPSSSKVPGKRTGNRWVLPATKGGPLTVPRVCASLRGAHFEGFKDSDDQSITVRPGTKTWEIRYKGRPGSPNMVLEFDSFPFLVDELKPIRQVGDGTLSLPAAAGQTIGNKLRFEPQPNKNTIGYWADASNRVFWRFEVTKPGEFNVGLLQGAGGSGGGTAKVSILNQDSEVVDSLDYKVQLTGHYQNFQWNHAGTLKIPVPGEYRLQVEALKIERAALMDLRQVHLSPKPGQ